MKHYKWYKSGTSPSKMWFDDEPKQKLVDMWPKDKMVKKGLKELKVTTYINTMHLSFLVAQS